MDAPNSIKYTRTATPAAGPGEIKTRLLSAFLSIACLSSHDIPEEMQAQFHRLRSLLTDTGPQNDIPKSKVYKLRSVG